MFPQACFLEHYFKKKKKNALFGKRDPGPNDLIIWGNAVTPIHLKRPVVKINVLKALKCLIVKTSLMPIKNPMVLKFV